MSAAKKSLRIATPCFSLAGIVLAIAIYHWPARQAPATSASVSLPSLQGAAAVEHLKQQGLYDSLGEAMTATRYGIKAVPEEQRSAHNSHFVANNPAQQLRTGFAPDGVELASATQPGAWRLGLKLQSAGYGDRQLVAGDGVPTAQGSRVEYERTLAAESAIGIQHWPQSAIKEWYVNTAEGLEQGFTLSRPPGEGRGGEPLRLALALAGELRTRAGADGQAVEFLDAAGNRVLRYDHLAASDVCGRPLQARMSVEGKELRLEVEDAAATYPVTIDPNFTQQAYLKASNTGRDDNLGLSVAVSGDTAVVGAYLEDSSATGVNGSQADNSASNSGAAYVFVRSGVSWSQQAYLKASNTEASDYFGLSVAVSGDTVVVGTGFEDSNATGVNGNQADNSAPDSGAAYVFVRSGTTWSQQAYLKASNTGAGDEFGLSVAVSGDTVVVGAWLEASNATGVNGNQADNSADASGAVYAFYAPPMVVTTLADEQNTNGQCSLREAIINANNDNQSGSTDCPAGSGIDRITFAVTGTINLASALADITQPLVIAGPGANLLTVRRDTGGNYRIFSFTGQSATLSGLTVTSGNTSGLGGGVFANGTQLVVNDCVITGNQAGTGGGIAAISGGALTINRTTISNNGADQAGGIYSQDRDAFIRDSTVSGNTGNDTGGIHNKASARINTVTLINTTLSGNMSTTGASAIRSEPSSPVFSIISLTNCTVTNNFTSSGGQPGAIWLQPTGTDFVTLKNTIVSGNTSGGAFSDITGGAGPSSSYNLVGAGGGLTNGTQGNIVGVFNPQLAALGNYGGPTQTHLLLAGSPAHNAGTINGAPAMDQRGYARPVGAGVDIGAVENDVTLTIAPNMLPNGQIMVPYSQQLSQTGGATGTITWTISSGNLPPNVTLNSSTGLISGAPTGSGTFNFTVAVTSQNGLACVKSYSLVINPCPAISITPASLPALTAFTFFSQQLTASGGTPSYFFAISAGALPSGVTLTGGGLLSGAPAVSGPYNFTVVAGDAIGCTGQRQYSGTIAANPGLMFYPLPRPVRLMDTRANQGNCDNVSTPIAAGTSLTTLARTTCEGITIPASAQAVVGNLTAINQSTQSGYLTIYPDGQAVPLASNMIYTPGQIIANNFTVALSGAGKFNVFGERSIDVVIDISGYYAPPVAGGLYYHPLSKPIRLLDTRANQGNCDNVSTPIAAGTSITTLARTTCEGLTIPPTAQALVANATVVNVSGQLGYMTIYPNGVTVPLASNLIYYPGQILSNAFTVSLNGNGEFNIFAERTIDAIVDVAGYYSADASDANGPGLLFTPLARPVRILDTRPNQGNCDNVSTPITGGSSIASPGRLTCEAITIPTAALSLLGNVTVINQTSQAGYLTLYPDGVATPLISNMVYFPNQLLANAFVVGVNSSTGQFRIFAERTLDAVVDVSGYFAP